MAPLLGEKGGGSEDNGKSHTTLFQHHIDELMLGIATDILSWAHTNNGYDYYKLQSPKCSNEYKMERMLVTYHFFNIF